MNLLPVAHTLSKKIYQISVFYVRWKVGEFLRAFSISRMMRYEFTFMIYCKNMIFYEKIVILAKN